MLFERLGGACHHRLPKLVDMAADRVVVEAAAAQLQDRPLQFALALAAEEIGGKIPVGRGRQGTGHLLANLAALVPGELPVELPADGRPEGVGISEGAQFAEDILGELRQFELLHLDDGQLHRDILAAERFDGRLA